MGWVVVEVDSLLALTNLIGCMEAASTLVETALAVVGIVQVAAEDMGVAGRILGSYFEEEEHSHLEGDSILDAE